MNTGIDERSLLQRLALGPVSGETLAQALGLTRAAVWKRIQALRDAGVAIDADAHRGYSLQQPLDLLDGNAILAAMPVAQRTRMTLEIAWSIDSTNSELLRRPVPSQGCSVLLAECQTGGRGRRGRTWASPLAAHVSVSLARSFHGGLARLAGLSLVAGVVACEALHVQGLTAVRLKWPNDLVVADGNGLRKLGGLLVEGGGEAAGSCRAVIGLGLNVRMPPAFAAAIDQPWIDLAGMIAVPPSRSALVGHLLATLLPALDDFEDNGLDPFLPRYAALDALAGRTVEIRDGSRHWNARALGVAADGALRVSEMDGQERRVHAGDVSVRA